MAEPDSVPFTVEQYRRFYAEEIRSVAGLASPALVEALARVPRERFLGPPPWRLSSGASLRAASYRTTSDARELYHDVFVALNATLSLNNGQPSIIARLLAALDLFAGKRVLHIGCGTGYYTAILAEVVGPRGAVTAVEVDPALATQAKIHLRDLPHVTVLMQDGATAIPGLYDAILVNAGITHPHPAWLDCLCDNGVLVLPLLVGRTPASRDALALRIQRRGPQLAAELVTLLTIYPSASLRDSAIQSLLNAAFESHRMLDIKILRRDAHAQTASCIVHAPAFCLSAEESAPPESFAPHW